MIYPIINEIYESGAVQDKDGNLIPLRGNIDQTEGMFLYDLIHQDETIERTLEVGCGFGLSSLFICSALKSRKSPQHIIIDPYQGENYLGIGILNLERSNVSFYDFIEEKSEFSLPEILKREPNSFDLIFIDGFHSYDQVSLDFFYANRLLRIGGYVIFDDCSFASISKVLSYILKFPAYNFHSQVKETSNKKRFLRFFIKILPEGILPFLLPLKLHNLINRLKFTSMVAIRKNSEDIRSNKWCSEF
jgi:predicted O-methyltransferase YrrM